MILGTALLSAHDDPGPKPDALLLNLIGELVNLCGTEDLPLLRARQAPDWCFCWPGEHYTLLASLVRRLQPRRVVEIGTGTGLSALSILPRLAPAARMLTIDVVPYDQIGPCMGIDRGSFLSPQDFEDGRLTQVIADISDSAAFARVAPQLQEADLIFMDGPKDGFFEPSVLERMENTGLKRGALLFLDDVRLFNMIPVWRAIAHPKIDLTTIGHYAGSGLVHWV
jgi:hypothetical protein